MKIKPTIYLLLIFLLFSSFNKEQLTQPSLPNIILIVADDLGYGDLSCYGQTKFQTPNIDKLAKDGILFTQHYAGAPVCAPSRCALLSAKHAGHITVRGNKKINKYGDYPLSDSDVILPQLCKQKGYITAMFGKWGLGYPGSSGDVTTKGFDEFFGYYGHLAAHNYYPEYLWHNNDQIFIKENKKYSNAVYAPILIQDSVLTFITRNKNQPFFLYLPTTIPHAELAAPAIEIDKYKDAFGKEKPYKGIKTIKIATRFGAYDAQQTPKAAFAAMIHLLDAQVGEIVDRLKAEGIYDNTILIFTSDNGPHKEGGAVPEYFNSNGGLRGCKRDVYEGGIRVPLIIQWPGKITPGVSDLISANYDLMPTLAEIMQVKMPANTDGISIVPTLLHQTDIQPTHPYLYWEFHEQGGKQALRMGKWKVVKLQAKNDRKAHIELYDLDKDVSETRDISGQFPEIVQQLMDLMEKAHTDSPAFPF
ncbi:MAG: arylsulfatase [Chitinophagales bacterium]